MANDLVQVIIGSGTPPANYTTAHTIGDGDAIVLTAPAGGCAAYFTVRPSSVVPSISPNSQGVYSLLSEQSYSFYFESSNPQQVQYQVGPPPTATLTPTGMNPQAHTVIVGGVGVGPHR